MMFWHRHQLRLPIVGSILKRALMARFCRSFAMMLRSGIPINQALSMVADAVDNVYIGQHVREMRTGVESAAKAYCVLRPIANYSPDW